MISIAPFRSLRAVHATLCVLAAAIIAVYQLDTRGTELAGGTLTGAFILAQELAGFFYIGSALLTFGASRASVIAALCAMALCLPLSLYSLAPHIFLYDLVWIFNCGDIATRIRVLEYDFDIFHDRISHYMLVTSPT